MPRFATKQFGDIEFDESAVIHFPLGLPAFEEETRFLLIQRKETAPVVFLQSLTREDLVFMVLPARLADASFRLKLQPEECEVLGLDASTWKEGRELVSLAILTVHDQAPVTANLLAPVVVAAESRRALQAIQVESGYRVDQPLMGVAPACS
jgi:flagellar assembly factor FliW